MKSTVLAVCLVQILTASSAFARDFDRRDRRDRHGSDNCENKVYDIIDEVRELEEEGVALIKTAEAYVKQRDFVCAKSYIYSANEVVEERKDLMRRANRLLSGECASREFREERKEIEYHISYNAQLDSMIIVGFNSVNKLISPRDRNKTCNN